jgi:hypothetical protein
MRFEKFFAISKEFAPDLPMRISWAWMRQPIRFLANPAPRRQVDGVCAEIAAIDSCAQKFLRAAGIFAAVK